MQQDFQKRSPNCICCIGLVFLCTAKMSVHMISVRIGIFCSEVVEVKRKYLLPSFWVGGCSTSGKVMGCRAASCTRNHVQVSLVYYYYHRYYQQDSTLGSCTSVYLDFARVSFWLMDPLAVIYLYKGKLKPVAHRNWLDGVGCQPTKGDPFWVSFLDLI